MDADDLTVQTVRDGAVCTLILGGALDLLAAGEFLQHAARVLDDRIERLVLDLAGVTFLDCAGVRALAIATCFAPGGCPVIIRSLSSPARRIITVLGIDRSEEHTSELQSRLHLVCRLLLEKKKQKHNEIREHYITSQRLIG